MKEVVLSLSKDVININDVHGDTPILVFDSNTKDFLGVLNYNEDDENQIGYWSLTHTNFKGVYSFPTRLDLAAFLIEEGYILKIDVNLNDLR